MALHNYIICKLCFLSKWFHWAQKWNTFDICAATLSLLLSPSQFSHRFNIFNRHSYTSKTLDYVYTLKTHFFVFCYSC